MYHRILVIICLTSGICGNALAVGNLEEHIDQTIPGTDETNLYFAF